MSFTDAQLQSFISLYEQVFGKRIGKDEAQRQATALVSLVKRTYQPMTEKDYAKYSKLAKSNDCDNI